MQKTLLAFAFVLAPALATAQSVTLAGAASPTRYASAERPSLAPAARARIDAHIAAAVERGMPAGPMHQLVAEGEARYASESRITAALTRLEETLLVAKRACVQNGRTPAVSEIIAGAEALAQGATPEQVTRIVAHTPPDRSLEVPLKTLAALAARGEAVPEGVAVIEARLAARAPDADIAAVAGMGGTRK